MKTTFISIILICLGFGVYGQASWEQFGQNRVQYRLFEWQYYDSTHFRTFYYDYGKANAVYAIGVAEQELSNIVYLMGGRLNKKLNIIIYNSFGDFRQTNLGRKNEENNEANGGKIDVVGDNIPVYFNGDHENLKKQIRKGIASVIKDNMLFGDNLKEIVKNAVRMNLPEWYTTGYVNYIADEWTPLKEAEIVGIIQMKKEASFLELANANPSLFGHSFWHFISTHYGENYISNLLYLTRYRKSVNSAIEIVLKKPAKEVFAEWQSHYLSPVEIQDKQDSLQGKFILARLKTKSDATYNNFATSPNGREIAYVEKKDGQYTVKVIDTKYNKSFEVLSGGIRAAQELADPDYPILSWSTSGKKLAVLYQKKNMLNLRIFTTGKRKMENRYISPNKIDRITGICFMEDENSLAVTGIKKGQSDLYRLVIRNSRFEPITKDLFDDKNPVFVQNGIQNGILFLSNRTTPFIGENSKSNAFSTNFNLYLYDPSKGTNLLQLSQSNQPILSPMQWGGEEFAFLQEENGKQIRKVIKIEKQLEARDTFSIQHSAPQPYTILKQDYLHNTGNVIEIIKLKNEYLFLQSPIIKLQEEHKNYLLSQTDTLAQQVNEDTVQVTDDYLTAFHQDTTHAISLENIFNSKAKSGSRYQLFTEAILVSKPKKYNATFYPDFIQTSLDNTLLFTRYQPFDYNGGRFSNPPLAGFITSTLTDVMEDYKIIGGARLGTDFNSLNYFFSFNNFRRRTDWDFLYFHNSTSNLYDFTDGVPPNYSPYPVLGKVLLDYFQTSFTYPFDMLQSVKFQLGLRYDHIRIKAKDKYSIEIPDDKQYWGVSRVEYVYDNSISPILNIRKGTRLKIFGEYQYKFNQETKGFYNFGYDARNYLTLYKNLILASRIAGAHSGGNAKILYFLGGVDNDLNPKQDLNTIIDFSQNYAFQSLATNLRGYRQGFRNGNSFMVVNEEIRLPIYNTFFKKSIKSGFIRNLQLVAFADIGSAWKGILPDENNIKNPNMVKDPNSTVTVYIENGTYDFGLGYGLGLRTRLLGYFLRSDFAWNIEGVKKPMIHISLATDF